MDRLIVYPGAIPLDTDVLSVERNVMIALGYAIQAVAGTGTVVDGLACNPTSPASMSVTIGQGSIIALSTIDANAFGSLLADADPLMKMGINAIGSTTFTMTAPSTSGYSVDYLIEAAFQEADGTPVTLPYYNASNPAQPYSGPGNSGTAQNTVRAQTVQLQMKAGSAAATGSQTAPGVDAGWVGLYVITVAYGQTSVASSNIVIHPTAPFILAKLPTLRRKLTANTSLYVNGSSGNDDNNGLSPSTAFLTWQGAWNAIISGFDLNGYSITVNVAAGTYAGLSAQGSLLGNTQGAAGITFVGASASTVTVSPGTGNAIQAFDGADFTLSNVTIQATGTGGGIGINASLGSHVVLSSGIIFGACATAHINASNSSLVQAVASYEISGSAPVHIGAGAAVVSIGSVGAITVTLSGTPAFSAAFCSLTNVGSVTFSSGTTFFGSATGSRYAASFGAVINTGGQSATYLPGNAAGTTASGGQYG